MIAKKNVIAVFAVLLALSFSVCAFASSTSSVNKPTTRKIDGWYISDDGRYGIQIFGLDKDYSGTYYATVYVKNMLTQQIVSSADIALFDKADVDEWNSLPSKYGYSGKASFYLPDDDAIAEFYHEGNKTYSFNIQVAVLVPPIDHPAYQVHSLSFTLP